MAVDAYITQTDQVFTEEDEFLAQQTSAPNVSMTFMSTLTYILACCRGGNETLTQVINADDNDLPIFITPVADTAVEPAASGGTTSRGQSQSVFHCSADSISVRLLIMTTGSDIW